MPLGPSWAGGWVCDGVAEVGGLDQESSSVLKGDDGGFVDSGDPLGGERAGRARTLQRVNRQSSHVFILDIEQEKRGPL